LILILNNVNSLTEARFAAGEGFSHVVLGKKLLAKTAQEIGQVLDFLSGVVVVVPQGVQIVESGVSLVLVREDEGFRRLQILGDDPREVLLFDKEPMLSKVKSMAAVKPVIGGPMEMSMLAEMAESEFVSGFWFESPGEESLGMLNEDELLREALDWLDGHLNS
jgi:hypothetical protein